MPTKFKITKETIMPSRLIDEISDYTCMHGNPMIKPYIFMNKATIDELIQIVGYGANGLSGSSERCMCGYFRGYKVFCDATLSFGEVELR